ncbi:hypothetical protein HYALB_00003489 [Hymenoscyphus albidus]|uniref:Adenosine deaminase domain-containing protein n=1 Tax=Hymenoscyphus albidus TaxID=595503 RepID=A0A9N9LNB7_9HELO|nr:hypothetical protein HYALB_00003489 [Hymenoscyphus albidus]
MEAPEMDFRALPKIELHAHLSGSISRECLHEVWLQKVERGETDLPDPLIEMPAGKHDYDLETFFPLFSKCIYNLITDLPSIRTTTLSALHSFASDGVIYLELRTTPRAIPSSNITKDLYISTILSVLHEFNTTSPMQSRLLISVDRRNTPAQAAEALALALKYKDQGVVGLDLCGDPSKGDISIFAPVFKQAKAAGLGIVLHFAEMRIKEGSEELSTLLSWNPDRVGHVIHVPEGTDNIGVFGSLPSNEYRLLAKHFNLSEKDVCTLARGAVDLIFADEGEKERVGGLMW